MSINVINISKQFGNFRALNNVSLTIPTGDLIALLGPSGSGKTTLLRIIAGLERADRGGTVLFNDRDVTNFDAGERRIGFVFQHYALFRHMTVFQNVAFGLKVRPRRQRPSKSDIKSRVMELLEKVQLPNLAHRYPSQLSGGQRQRVALARALAVEPDVLLLDEPFGALDAGVRRDLRQWMRRLHDQIGVTSVFVTHDQEEALELADHVAILNAGRIEQVGTPEEVYENPATPFVMRFLGSVNTFPGQKQREPNTISYARPHDIAIARIAAEPNAVPVKVNHVSVTGPVVRVSTIHQETTEIIEVELTREQYKQLSPKHGDVLYAWPRATHVFPEEVVV